MDEYHVEPIGVVGAELDRLALAAFNICKAKGWERDWESVGCYLHLEVSEYIEAKRDKEDDARSDDHISEAADILFVLLSSLVEDSVGPSLLIDALRDKVDLPTGVDDETE